MPSRLLLTNVKHIHNSPLRASYSPSLWRRWGSAFRWAGHGLTAASAPCALPWAGTRTGYWSRHRPWTTAGGSDFFLPIPLFEAFRWPEPIQSRHQIPKIQEWNRDCFGSSAHDLSFVGHSSIFRSLQESGPSSTSFLFLSLISLNYLIRANNNEGKICWKVSLFIYRRSALYNSDMLSCSL